MALCRHYHLSMDFVLSLKWWEYEALVQDLNKEAAEASNPRAGRPPGSTPVIT